MLKNCLRVEGKCEIKPQESKMYTSARKGLVGSRRWMAKMIVTRRNNQTSTGTIVNIKSPLFLAAADPWISHFDLGCSISFWKAALFVLIGIK